MTRVKFKKERARENKTLSNFAHCVRRNVHARALAQSSFFRESFRGGGGSSSTATAVAVVAVVAAAAAAVAAAPSPLSALNLPRSRRTDFEN